MINLEDKMQKTIDSTKNKLDTIRTGRANPELLSRIQVEYYGTSVPINQVCSINVSEGNTFVLNIFDKNAVQSIEKSIMKSDLNINPQTEGNIIRLRLPDLTEERRKELIKIVKHQGEEGKVSLRNIRREHLESLKKSDETTEDELKSDQDEAQKTIDKFYNLIDNLIKEKEAEIMHV